MRTAALCMLMACGGSDAPADCALEHDLVPGCGVVVEGAELRLGDTRVSLESALGQPERTEDLGPLGLRFRYPGLGLTGFFDAEGRVSSLAVTAPFAGRSAGAGLGDAPAAFTRAHGQPDADPFSDTAWYPALGLSVQWADGVAERLQIEPAR